MQPSRTGTVGRQFDGRRVNGGTFSKPARFSERRDQFGKHRHQRTIVIGQFPVYYYPLGYCFYYSGSYYPYGYGSYFSDNYSRPADYPTFHQLGYDWGEGLAKALYTWAQFVEYLAEYIVTAPNPAIEEFRTGFVAGFNTRDASAVFARALTEARE